MVNNALKIIFMGTPEFAVPSLNILVENGFHVAAVVTAPDRPQGRGQKLTFSPVKEAALKHNIPVLQPTNLKAPDFIQTLKSYGASLQVVVAFRMLPEAVWAMPSIGTFNLHASLLPQYRGAAPINWAIINGETETGVTTFFLKHEIDTGSIIFQEKEPIHADDDAGALYERLMRKGAALVLRTVRAIEAGNFAGVPQPENLSIRHAPKIFKETCRIDWHQTPDAIVNFVRGLSPYPAAWTVLGDKTFKVFKVSRGPAGVSQNIGTFLTNNKDHLRVQASNGWVNIELLQPEGKKKMTTEEFFRGNKL
ncbi:MAG: methionyl-tRNA formyltransferase [Limnobacter sp.]|nr:methionyl-tRNA formyltransferase [Limnobacter sp.]